MPLNHLFYICLICASMMMVGLNTSWEKFTAIEPNNQSTQNQAPEQNNLPEGTRYYVAQSGNNSDGKSWAKAFTKVQDALSVATIGDEIWVAGGVYTPGTNQEASFNLVPGVALYGGFDTNDEKLSDRDWVTNVTVLSGDIDGNDVIDDNGVVTGWWDIKGKNSFNVVVADGTTGNPITGSTILDGFTITAANADGSDIPQFFGGGFYCNGNGSGNECSPSLKNVNFSGNMARTAGGAMENDGASGGISSPSLTNVTFSGNSAKYGGAIYNLGFNKGTIKPNLDYVIFIGNAAEHGGAMYNEGIEGTSIPSLTQVQFYGNWADKGGAIYNDGTDGGISNPILTNVLFAGNSAYSHGGAIYNDGYNNGTCNPSLTNVTFSGNKADKNGGAIYNDAYFDGEANPSIVNVTFSANSAVEYGGAIYNDGSENGNSNPEIRNSILWNNQDKSGTSNISAAIFNNNATTKLIHSLVQGSFSGNSWIGGTYVNGGGNIDKDPMFAIPIDASTAPTTAGNLRLRKGSPAINAGKNEYVTVATDLDGSKRIVDGVVDMGAYEALLKSLLPIIIR